MEASSEDQSSPKTTTARSYECVFCKRGFSNAQALGGHMNMHRKDRRQPKLKQYPTNQTLIFPFNISSKVIIPPFSPSSLMGYAQDVPQQLSLFVETPSRGGDDRASSSLGWRHEEFGPLVEELDLELRLGPQRPVHDSMVLREFL